MCEQKRDPISGQITKVYRSTIEDADVIGYNRIIGKFQTDIYFEII